MMTRVPVRPLDRRSLLRGALGGVPLALGLPCLEAMLDGNGGAYADGAPLARRFGVWFFGAGAHREWTPAAVGPLALPVGMTPLERHKAAVTLISGLHMESFGNYSENRHFMGASSVLTGTPPRGGKPGGTSIDQLVALHLRAGKRASVEVGITDSSAVSYGGADSPNRPTSDPRKVFDALFGPGAGGSSANDTKLRALYLDAIKDDAAGLRRQLGAHDVRRLDSYLDGIAELRREIEKAPASVAPCPPPGDALAEITDDTLKNRAASFPKINRAMARLLATALACHHTQVFSVTFSGPNSTPWFPTTPGLPNNHHELGHQLHPELSRSVGYIMERLAEWLDAFAAVKDGTGTLLDSVGMLVTSEVARNHEGNNMPVLLVGRAGGALRGGVHVKATGPTTRASFTLARAVGAPLAGFGTGAATANEVIPGVLV